MPWLIAAACVAAGAALLGAGALGPEGIRRVMDRLSPKGSADSFGPGRVGQIVARMRLYGACCLVAGAGALALRGPLTRWGARALAGAPVMLRGWGREMAAFARREPGQAAVLLALTGAAVAIRLVFLGRPMMCDEAETYLTLAARSPVYGLSEYPSPNNHLLYTLLSHITTRVLGGEPWAIRLPALAAGAALTPAAYVAGRLLYGRAAALVGAGLVTASPFLIYYSVNGRGYILVCLFFVLLLAIAARLVRRPAATYWALFALLGAAGFYSIPTMLLPFGACAIWMALESLRQGAGGRWGVRRKVIGGLIVAGAATVALTAALYLPVLVVSGHRSVTANRYIVRQTGEVFRARLAEYSQDLLEFSHAGAHWAAAVLGVAALAGLLGHARIGRTRVPIVLPVMAWSVAFVALKGVVPYPRVWTFLLPVYAMAAGAGLIVVAGLILGRSRGRVAGMVTGVALAGALFAEVLRTRAVDRIDEGQDLRDAAAIVATLQERARPGDVVLCGYPGFPILRYYAARAGLPCPVIVEMSRERPFDFIVLHVPLEKLDVPREAGLPPLREDDLRPVQDFPGARLYRVEPPYPGPEWEGKQSWGVRAGDAENRAGTPNMLGRC
jgi:hypothetical protein